MAMRHEAPIPVYSLFGQAAGLVEPRFCHVERIGDRWKLHGGHVEEHSHPHLHQMSLWISGSGTYAADELVTAISANTLCWMPSGVVHGFQVNAGSEAIVLSMSDDFAREQLASLAGPGEWDPFQDRLVLPLEDDSALWIRRLFDRMEHEYAGARPRRADCIGALARLALAEADRVAPGHQPPVEGGIGEASLLVRFMARVEARLGDRPNIDAFAAELGTTPYLLNRACRTRLGLRASEVIRQRHIQETKRLLLFTNLPVGEIGQLLGYRDPAHFARSFRTTTGETPRDWRENQKRLALATHTGEQGPGAVRQ